MTRGCPLFARLCGWGLLMLANVACDRPPAQPVDTRTTNTQNGESPRPPDVLIITLDTTRADHLGCYGNEQIHTPNLDGLAADGVRFHDAYSVQPVTLPAHASIMTGQYPFRHGVRDNNIYSLSDKSETLAKVLSAAGYLTTAFVASTVLNHKFGLANGFAFYNDRFVKPKQKGRLPVDRRAEEVSFLGVEWLTQMEQRLQETPFFLWLHYYDPHADYDPPQPYRAAYGNPYDGEIAYMDDWIGYVMDDLKARGRYDNTMIVVVGDHGESLGDHGEKTHGMFIYRAVTRVPLIVKFPRQQHKGKVVTQRVSQVDIVPTVYSVLGLSGAAEMDGTSLLPVIDGSETSHRDVYSEVFIPRSFHWSELKGLRKGKQFFIDAPRPELYDIAGIQTETDNLHEALPEDAAEMAGALSGMMAGVVTPEAPQVTLDAEMEARLRQLGYFVATEQHTENGAYQKDPKDMVVVFNAQQRANSLMEMGRFEAAAAVYNKLMEQDGDNPRFALELASVYTSLEDYKQAIRWFDKAISLDPDNLRVFLMYGNMFRQAGKPEKAVEQFESALVLDAQNSTALFQLGALHAELKQYDKAEAFFRKRLKLGGSPALLNNLGFVLIKGKKDVEGGIRFLQRAVDKSANKGPYLFSLASAYRNNAQPARAIATMETAVSLTPGNTAYLEELRSLHAAAGHTTKVNELTAQLKQLQN